MLGPCSALDPFLACLNCSTEEDFVDAVMYGCVATVASNAAAPGCSYVAPLSASVASASGCLVTAACCFFVPLYSFLQTAVATPTSGCSDDVAAMLAMFAAEAIAVLLSFAALISSIYES